MSQNREEGSARENETSIAIKISIVLCVIYPQHIMQLCNV